MGKREGARQRLGIGKALPAWNHRRLYLYLYLFLFLYLYLFPYLYLFLCFCSPKLEV